MAAFHMTIHVALMLCGVGTVLTLVLNLGMAEFMFVEVFPGDSLTTVLTHHMLILPENINALSDGEHSSLHNK